ncbi:6323_t:CDS:2 [Cetraspora pellucida]|uniref:6323_t:CDS:1 n=1 Tax=Cetraspora pellucida TaxID=1433469 RepID=A0ACA9K7U5_9GLOM|nr:6323_t:CDS:2 [Cetraspora pellucida]
MSIEDGKYVQQNNPAPPKIANPGPLGLSGFALTTFVLSIHNAGSSDVAAPNITVGLALFYGGLVQLLAGMWEFKTGNTFGATAFSSYGGFWMSFAAILIPGFGISGSEGLAHAIGIYLLAWTIFTFLLFLATFRSNVGILLLFLFLTLTFLLLTIGVFTTEKTTPPEPAKIAIATKIGGVLGIITALIAWYNALAGLVTYATIPTFDLSGKRD